MMSIAVNFTHRASRRVVFGRFRRLPGTATATAAAAARRGERRSRRVPGRRAATTAQAKVFQSLLSALLELTGFSLDQVLGVPDLVLDAGFLVCCKFPREVKLGGCVSQARWTLTGTAAAGFDSRYAAPLAS